MRITSDDAEGCAEVGNFIDPEATYPVIVTTSRLLSTEVEVNSPLRKAEDALRRAEGARKTPCKFEGAAHAEPVEAWGGVLHGAESFNDVKRMDRWID